jgi:sugar porter (SP) family MFS transporter
MKQGYILRNAMIAALGGFLFGYDIAMISGTTSYLQSEFGLNDLWLGFTVMIAVAGTIIGTIIIGNVGDRYGRKQSMIVLALIYSISALGSAMAMNWSVLLAFRFITGICVGAISVLAPMYIAEISPSKIRGRLVILNQLNVVIAIFLAYFVNYYLNSTIGVDPWRWMLGVEVIPGLLFFGLLFTIPASPRLLLLKGHINEAREVLLKIEPDNVDQEITEIQAAIEKSKKTGRVKLFTSENRFPVILTILIAMFNQFAGINAIIYYAPRIFEQTGLAADTALLQSIAIGGTNLIFTLIAITIIDRFGRRNLLMVGSVGMVFFLGMIARAFYLQEFDSYSVMIYLIGYIAFFAISQGAVLWVFISEIFPHHVRSKGQALGSFTHWFLTGVLALLFPVVASAPSIGGGPIFSFFAIMMTLQFFFAWRMMPETKGKSLEEIQDDFAKRRAKESKQ